MAVDLAIAEVRAATRGRRVRFITLLQAAADRQVLRRAGAVYQFRHAALQDFLLTTPSDGRDASLPGSETPWDSQAIKREVQKPTQEADDLVRRMSVAVRRSGDDSVLKAMFDLLAAEVPIAIASVVDREVGRSAMLLQQISHQLNTPLGHIEAMALLLRNSDDSQSLDFADGLIGAVRMCKATLGGFRRASGMGLHEVLWAPSSLASFVRESLDVLRTEHKRDCIVTVDLPNSFDGYHNSFLACVLMPIMENAVEPVPDGGNIIVRAEAGMRDFSLLVSNSEAGDVDLSDSIFRPHFTGKDGHTGLGLSAVQDLLATYTGSEVNCYARDGMTTFTVTLPGRITA
ncbi:sensor histidine kinase [Actinoplanes sp. CA-030573]|uniref:sensor histidine kinase n=1 Tax=Actinoplanes sp. CA-030573 TaxID=3239898 RepID=UPI003D90BF11